MTDEAIDNLVEQAIQAQQQAYAPYSDFRVGAALLTTDGTVFTGCNVENASLGLTICAERVAMASAVAQGHREFSAIAIASKGAVTPCGACRQFMHEFAPQLRIMLADCGKADGEKVEDVRQDILADLLPDSFQFDK